MHPVPEPGRRRTLSLTALSQTLSLKMTTLIFVETFDAAYSQETMLCFVNIVRWMNNTTFLDVCVLPASRFFFVVFRQLRSSD
jgi:hypothetical protein